MTRTLFDRVVNVLTTFSSLRLGLGWVKIPVLRMRRRCEWMFDLLAEFARAASAGPSFALRLPEPNVEIAARRRVLPSDASERDLLDGGTNQP